MRPLSVIVLCTGFGCAAAAADSEWSSQEKAPESSPFEDEIGCAAASEWLRERASKFTQFAYNPFEEEIGGPELMGLRMEGVLNCLGEPLETTVSGIPDRSGLSTDTQYVFHYDGFDITLQDVGLGVMRSAIQHMEVTGGSHPLKFGIKIGASYEAVISAFPPLYGQRVKDVPSMLVPSNETNDAVEPSTTYMSFNFYFGENDMLTKIWISNAYH